jgi:hypothetical protein
LPDWAFLRPVYAPLLAVLPFGSHTVVVWTGFFSIPATIVGIYT